MRRNNLRLMAREVIPQNRSSAEFNNAFEALFDEWMMLQADRKHRSIIHEPYIMSKCPKIFSAPLAPSFLEI